MRAVKASRTANIPRTEMVGEAELCQSQAFCVSNIIINRCRLIGANRQLCMYVKVMRDLHGYFPPKSFFRATPKSSCFRKAHIQITIKRPKSKEHPRIFFNRIKSWNKSNFLRDKKSTAGIAGSF
jgi:hypothetical protein